MIKAMIVEDEVINIHNLQQLLKKYCPIVEVTATASGIEEAKQMIIATKPDLLFLDIQLSGGTGFDLLKSISNYSFEIIFITAYDNYGIEAVKLSAIDYLLKPIDTDELVKAIDKVIERQKEKKQNGQLENLIRLLQYQQQKEEHRIALPTVKETFFVNPSNIIRCESSNNYTRFFLNNSKELIVSKSIYEFEELLQHYGFIRCHQSHLVNRKYVKSLLNIDGTYLLLEDNSQVPVSKRKKDLVKESLSKNNFL